MTEAAPQTLEAAVRRDPAKIFPVSWDQFHRDSRALAWRLTGAGPFEAMLGGIDELIVLKSLTGLLVHLVGSSFLASCR